MTGTVLAVEGEALETNFLAVGDALSQADVFGLQTLQSLLHNERDSCPFIERTVSARGDSGKMDEDVLPVLALNKAKTFSRIKPLYGSCFFHCFLSSCCPCFPAL